MVLNEKNMFHLYLLGFPVFEISISNHYIGRRESFNPFIMDVGFFAYPILVVYY